MLWVKLLLLFLFGFYIEGLAQFQLQPAFPNLLFSNPVDLQYANDGSDRLFVVEQKGIIKVFQNSSYASAVKIFLDITDRVNNESTEMGLLGLAFHPDFKNNGYFYVNYTISSPTMMTRISRFKVSSSNPDSADKNSELIILALNQPFNNHKGGQTTFGPDGYLYLGLGDGGSEGDPLNYGQNKTILLGKILRIDINTPQGTLNYSIPPDNPFIGNSIGYKKEIYAYGFRNPWRFSFDPVTGWLWCGDVGQDAWEEIDIVQKGKNYGWRCYEGSHPYNLTTCYDSDYVQPIFNYDHSNNNCCIIGGFVYRGQHVPELYGKYIYADYCSKNLWSLQYDSTGLPIDSLLLTSPYGQPYAFGIDKNREIYMCASDGKIYSFKPTVNSVITGTINPYDYYLTQNYPNPFNPSTYIKFNVPEISNVHIRILDIIGRIVNEIYSGTKPIGGYDISWTPTNIASGIYFTQMTASSLSSNKSYNKIIKMVYIK
jgi:glucose/arabinose dehydrogenase